MKKIITGLVVLSTIVTVFSACHKNDYIVGGLPEDINMYKNTSTYDVLKNYPQYDTLLQIIDAAGLKDKINEQGTTFFAPSDYAIFSYLSARTYIVQHTINQNSSFGLDSLKYYLSNNIKGTRDSLLMYLIKQPLNYPALTETGKYYPSELVGDSVIVSYEETNNTALGYNSVVSSFPRIVYFTHLWYPYVLNDANPASKVPTTVGIHTLVKTSCIPTKNGFMNFLDNSHVLFFYGTKK